MNKQIKLVIIDDEPDSITILKNIIENHIPAIEIIATAGSVKDGVKVVDKFKPDLLFLDIQLVDGLGFDILESVSYHDFDVIFITSYDNFAIKAFKFSALHYILKPVSVKDIRSAVDRYVDSSEKLYSKEKLDVFIDNYKLPHDQIALPDIHGTQFFELINIIRVESDGAYSKFFIYPDKHELTVSKNLKVFEEALKEFGFIRIHNKHLINIKHIKKYIRTSPGRLLMSDGIELDISHQKKNEVINTLENLVVFFK